jgi:hypothetical protein
MWWWWTGRRRVRSPANGESRSAGEVAFGVLDRALLSTYKVAACVGLRELPRYAQVAQLVEHATENRSVGGSIPPLGTMLLIRC